MNVMSSVLAKMTKKSSMLMAKMRICAKLNYLKKPRRVRKTFQNKSSLFHWPTFSMKRNKNCLKRSTPSFLFGKLDKASTISSATG